MLLTSLVESADYSDANMENGFPKTIGEGNRKLFWASNKLPWLTKQLIEIDVQIIFSLIFFAVTKIITQFEI